MTKLHCEHLFDSRFNVGVGAFVGAWKSGIELPLEIADMELVNKTSNIINSTVGEGRSCEKMCNTLLERLPRYDVNTASPQWAKSPTQPSAT